MDPMIFASLVGLLSEFVSHRRVADKATLEEFTAWLSERRHEELVALLGTTSAVAIGTKALLNETRDVLLSRLTAIDRALVQYASAVEGFSQLANAASPSGLLSEQAVDILRQIDRSGASKVLEMHSGEDGGTSLFYLDGEQNGDVSISDSRFLQDDLRCLSILAYSGRTSILRDSASFTSLELLRRSCDVVHNYAFKPTAQSCSLHPHARMGGGLT